MARSLDPGAWGDVATSNIVDPGGATDSGVTAHYPDDVTSSDPGASQKLLAMSIASASEAGYDYDSDSIANVAFNNIDPGSSVSPPAMTDTATTDNGFGNAFASQPDPGIVSGSSGTGPNAVVANAAVDGGGNTGNPAAGASTFGGDPSAVANVDIGGAVNGGNGFGSWADTANLWQRDTQGRRRFLR